MSSKSQAELLIPATPRDAARLAHILADAFTKDPAMNWVLGGPKAVKSVFSAMIRHVYLTRGRSG
jgi:hypothetical protein